MLVGRVANFKNLLTIEVLSEANFTNIYYDLE